MLIRVRGHNSGIKEYLENGQKKGRDMARDDMDERVILAGDLRLTHEIIESMNTSAERYLTVTMSFREDDIEPQTLAMIVADFEDFAFSAYRRDEYVLYAEAHLPKIKSYANRRSGEPVERKPHIHLVIPAVNLLSGQRMEPFGRVEIQQKYIDAFQEHINHKYGLASPKDNRRVEFTDASEMISRYKGDVFEGSNARLKNEILHAVLERDVTSMDGFKEVLSQFGEIRARNAGSAGEYLNVKPDGAAKGVNLKEFAFSRQFIELDAEAKQAALAATHPPKYETAGSPKATPASLLSTLREWDEVRAKEVKYLNGAFRAKYREMTPGERRATLYDREQHFYNKHDNEDHHEQRDEQRVGLGRQPSGRAWRDPLSGREITSDASYGPDWELDPYAVGTEQAPGGRDGLRDLSRSGMDVLEDDRAVLLPNPAHVQLEERQPATADRLRRDRSRGRAGSREGGSEGRGAEGQKPGQGSSLIVHDWREALEREYARYVASTAEERRAMAAHSASKLHRQFGNMKGGASLPPEIVPREAVSSLADVADLHAAPTMPGAPRRLSKVGMRSTPLDAMPDAYAFDSAPDYRRPLGRSTGDATRLDRRRAAHVSLDAGVIGGDFRRGRSGRPLPYRRPLTGEPTPVDRFASRLDVPDVPGRYRRRHGQLPRNSVTGRVVDSLTAQLERDRNEATKRQSGGIRSEFQQIKQDLAADRLLGALSHSHGLIPEKYAIWKGRDGADRIRCGSRSLNVSDFLTKEMNLSWGEASQILRTVYREQVEKDPDYRVRRPPQERLWAQFQEHRRETYRQARAGWAAQGVSERDRRAAIRDDFRRTRAAVQDNPHLTASQKRAAMSAARLERAEIERKLRAAIELERAARRESSVPRLEAHYRSYLAERAEKGESSALDELRRIQHVEAPALDSLASTLRDALDNEPNAILYDGPQVTREVLSSGVVEYSVDGNVALDDEARSLRVWSTDDPAVNLALRMAVMKFGGVLAVSGPDDFRESVALAAADAGVRVEFDDNRMNEIAGSRRQEIAERNRLEREREAARRKAIERIAREAIMSPSPDKGVAPSTEVAKDADPQPAPDADPERCNSLD